MAKQSAGILLFRRRNQVIEVLLVHPGGPFWAKKDNGAWSIPKGEIENGESNLEVAKREFQEELGQAAPETRYTGLGEVKLKSGKIITAWAAESDMNLANFKSNTFQIEWPPKSGNMSEFPEVDKAQWFNFQVASKKLNPAQATLLHRLSELLDYDYVEPVQTSLL